MTKQAFFVAILGAGSAGYAAARTFAEAGKSVALIDGSAELGGLCILRGCMPSKTLIYSAELLHLAQNAPKFGLSIGDAKVDMPGLLARKRAMVKEFADYRAEQISSERFTLFRSFGRLKSPTEILLADGSVIEAEKIIISTGSKVQWPDVPGLKGNAVTSDEVLELDTLPEKVVILGGGVIACELAQYLQRIGAKVSLIQRSPHILKEYSPEVSKTLEESFREEGMQVFTDTKLLRVEKEARHKRIVFKHSGSELQLDCDQLVNCLGREAAVSELGLADIGLRMLSSGQISTNDFQQTNLENIYACGDCTGPHEIVHIAILQGETAAKHALGKAPAPIDYAALLRVVFTDPQLTHVGPSEKELVEKYPDALVAEYPFADHGKSIVMEAKRGFVKIWARKSDGQIIAAQCLGKDAGELIHSMSVAVGCKLKAEDLIHKVQWYHPTLSEIWAYPLEEIVETHKAS